jgi:hypothetical protein
MGDILYIVNEHNIRYKYKVCALSASEDNTVKVFDPIDGKIFVTHIDNLAESKGKKVYNV